ncbi:peptidylprolyl isomerase [Psychromarinibacter halotolerans]|uniref:Peptidyl-prolyl cis-trans isomerase n=1 Tax=Psychromarinibacter halotolerans TaxID=1775175 RepID=A0ABV7GPF6_9RHOB|nr:peptidylprolyl isomerase [Psychromarinibacter halotolerans]MDF0597012.1 SurA N-terminal domain-containing protein [Psychromarinibacter halotolerans]
MAKKKSAYNAVVWVILLLLIVGLAGFGATNFGGTVNSVGSVGNRDISVDRYARELQNELASLSQQFGTNLTLQQAQMFGIDQAVLQRILSTTALENEAERIGLSVGDQRVGEQVLNITAFQGVDGEFDREGYRFALQNAGLSESEFEEGLRMDLARTLMQEAVSGAAAMPDAYVDALLSYAEETRDFTWTVLTAEDLDTPIADPSEDDLSAFWEENPDSFMLPETRDITYALITPEMVAGTIEGDDEALQRLYDERIDEFRQPERRLVERLIYTDPAAAQTAADALAAGETTFEDLVAERGLDLVDVDMGDVAQDELGAAGEPVFALEEPGVVGPIDTDFGPALFRMNAVLEAQETPFEEAREQLLVEYRTDAARRAVADMIDGIDDLLAGGATLEEVGEETEMETGQIDWTEGATDGVAAYLEFRQAALEAEVGDFPEIIETSDGALFALRVNEVIEPRVEPFDEARDDVEAEWRRVNTVAALAEQARALAEAGMETALDDTPAEEPVTDASEEEPATEEDTATETEGDATATDTPDAEAETDEAVTELDFPIVEEPAGIQYVTETGIGRDGFIPDTPTDFVAAIFEMEPGDTQAIEGTNAAYLVRLDAINEPDLSDPAYADAAAQLRDQLASSLGQDILGAYAATVQSEAGISLNQTAINAVHAQFP